jgi:chromosome segregation ATPase
MNPTRELEQQLEVCRKELEVLREENKDLNASLRECRDANTSFIDELYDARKALSTTKAENERLKAALNEIRDALDYDFGNASFSLEVAKKALSHWEAK